MSFSISLSLIALTFAIAAMWVAAEVAKKVLHKTRDLYLRREVNLLKHAADLEESIKLQSRELSALRNEAASMRTEWRSQKEEFEHISEFANEFEAAWNQRKIAANRSYSDNASTARSA